MPKSNNEFEIIQKYFAANNSHRSEVVLGIGDDCALVDVPQANLLAVSTDTSVAGVHFFPDTAASAIGYKSLAVSLSDLAAMGADPALVMLSLTLPQIDTLWLRDFSEGFFKLAHEYSLQLIGGDTTRGPLAITTQVFGYLPKKAKALRRDLASPGELIYVTGCLGDAGLALRAMRHELTLSTRALKTVKQRLDLPQPRVMVGKAIRDIATAAIDISDGLAADLNHILERSQVGATINLQSIPLSSILKNNLPFNQAIELALSAGDDYELCFTVPPAKKKCLESALDNILCPYTCIGIIEEQKGLRLKLADGKAFPLSQFGYVHFAE